MKLNLVFNSRVIITLLVFLGLVLFLSLLSPKHSFVSLHNLSNLLAFGPEFSLVAISVGLLMISGEFDLSIGSIVVICSFFFISMGKQGINPFLAAMATLGAGSLIGSLNGLITTKGGIPSFITTLGGMMFWRGLTLLLSRGYNIPFSPAEFPVFSAILTGKIGGFLPVQVIWFGIGALILGILLHFHKFGNWIYATGDNEQAAKARGINTDRVKIICFMIVGFLCALVAMIQVVRTSAFTSRAAEGWALLAIAASVVGGTSLRGGIGGMTGIFLGALTISVIENGLVTLRISYSWTYVVYGLIIVTSVISNRYLMGRSDLT